MPRQQKEELCRNPSHDFTLSHNLQISIAGARTRFADYPTAEVFAKEASKPIAIELLSCCCRVASLIPDKKPSLQAKTHSGGSRHRVPAHVFVLLFSRSTRKGLIGSTMRLLSSHVFHQRDSPLLQSTLVFLSSPCPSSNDNGCTTTCLSTPESLLSTGLPLR